jgi:hypothetical protein
VDKALDALIGKFEWQLLFLARRLFALEAFKTELDRVTRTTEFRIRNDIVWFVLLDSRDMLVVHLASWAKGIYEPSGLLGLLQANYSRDLPRVRPSEGDEKQYGSWAPRRGREHIDSFSRLFPSTADPFPSVAAFSELKGQFVARLKPVCQDRHENRAHPYDKAGKGSAKMLDLVELRDAIAYCQTFMNDVSMVGCHHALDYHEMNSADSGEVARDLVDMLLLGTSEDIVRIRRATERDKFYSELHRMYDPHRTHHSLPPGSKWYFNDNLWRDDADLTG